MHSLTESAPPSFAHRLKLAVLAMLLSLAGLFLVAAVASALNAYTPLCEVYRRGIEEAAKKSFVDRALAIFLNNFGITALTALPFAGPIIYSIAIVSTGYALYCITYISGVPLSLAIAALLLAPHTYIEMYAYSVVLVNSIAFSINILRRRFLEVEFRYLIKALALSSLLLLVAAFLESLLIELSRGPTL